jgi:hypothetical protein
MNYLRRTAGYSLLDQERNEEILEEIYVTSSEGKNCRHTDANGSETFIELKTTGSLNNF